jgi:hypothetical protein
MDSFKIIVFEIYLFKKNGLTFLKKKDLQEKTVFLNFINFDKENLLININFDKFNPFSFLRHFLSRL